MCGDLSLIADGFRCRPCDGTIQEAYLADDLMVDGETFRCVKSFCYLGDTLDADGGVDLDATSRIRNGWMKSRERLPFLTSRVPPREMKQNSNHTQTHCELFHQTIHKHWQAHNTQNKQIH